MFEKKESYLTGNEIVDSLQGLQKVADNISSPTYKVEHVRKGTRLLQAQVLIGRQMMVSSALVLAIDPRHNPDERIMFNNGFTFMAQLEAISYLQDEDIPIDSLSLNFAHPEMFGVTPDDDKVFRTLTLQVPVLAIDMCLGTEAA